MKRIFLAITVLTLGLMATDFSSMTTEELIALRGTVSADEIDAYREEMQSRIPTLTPEQQELLRSSRQGQGAGGAGTSTTTTKTPITFSDIDSDGDGKITEEELDTYKEERVSENLADGKLAKNIDSVLSFDSIDTNGDGEIDQTEFDAYQSTHSLGANSASQQGTIQHAQGVGGGMGQHLGTGGGQGMGRNR